MALFNRNRAVREEPYDEFHESMAATGRPVVYREVVGEVETPSVLSAIVSTIGGILSLLLALRIVIGLINPDQGSALVAGLYNMTDWMVRPFANWIGLQGFSAGRYLDWPAVVALAVVAIITYALTRLFSHRAAVVR